MAFLDNSGDIILDAVLTDTGRFRLARGDGSFKIVKYAFADDEIDYGSYNNDHASGSAYYDLDVLKTPVLEAFTNNASSMKHKLLSIPRPNLLYLPTMVLNEDDSTTEALSIASRNDIDGEARGFYVVCTDSTTEDVMFGSDVYTSSPGGSDPNSDDIEGVLKGVSAPASQLVTIDQGLNTSDISFKFSLDPDLRETRYIIRIDNRLGGLVSAGGSVQTPNFVDDDHIASYTITEGTFTDGTITTPGKNKSNQSPISGPRGTRLAFGIVPSVELNSSTFLFTKLGTSGNTWKNSGTSKASNSAGGDATFYIIDSIVRVVGATTGNSLDIPVRFLKFQA
jgi:hypothetical protein